MLPLSMFKPAASRVLALSALFIAGCSKLAVGEPTAEVPAEKPSHPAPSASSPGQGSTAASPLNARNIQEPNRDTRRPALPPAAFTKFRDGPLSYYYGPGTAGGVDRDPYQGVETVGAPQMVHAQAAPDSARDAHLAELERKVAELRNRIDALLPAVQAKLNKRE